MNKLMHFLPLNKKKPYAIFSEDLNFLKLAQAHVLAAKKVEKTVKI